MNILHSHPRLSKFIFAILLIITVLLSWIVRLAGAGWYLFIFGIPLIFMTFLHIGIHVRTISRIPRGKPWLLLVSDLSFFFSMALHYDSADTAASNGIALIKFMGFTRPYDISMTGNLMRWLDSNSNALTFFALLVLFGTGTFLLWYQYHPTAAPSGEPYLPIGNNYAAWGARDPSASPDDHPVKE